MATSPSTTTPRDIVRLLTGVRTPAQVEEILSQAAAAGIASERCLGDRENNAGTVQIASNPYSAIVERVTNANDGVLELQAELHAHEPMPATPRKAATRWLGVPATGINDLRDDRRRALAEHVRVLLDESGRRTHPTVVIADDGIGQHPADFPDTLLSLNRSNKLRKRWLQGAYGQGGSATFRFCDYSVIVARRAPQVLEHGKPDLVGWTVVWEDEGDPYEDALPVYKYLVGPDAEVPTFDPALQQDPEWHGVVITHVAYELRRYAQAYTQLTTGAWGMLHAHLFDPVLPFIIGGRREIDIKATRARGTVSTRVVVGNAARLNSPKGPAGDLEVSYRNSEIFDLSKSMGCDMGRFRLSYWVVQRDLASSATRDPTDAYVTSDSAVSMTLYGQRQDTERRAWLKNQLRLPFLQRNLIVQIDVDELSPPAKRQLFSSTRERGVQGELRETIYREAAALLRADAELKRLEQDERDRMRTRSAARVGQQLRTKLGRFIATLQRDAHRVGAGASRTGDGPPPPPPPPAPPRDSDDSRLPEMPTTIAFGRDPIVIAQGRRTTVWVTLDAKNGYLRRHEHQMSVTLGGLDDSVVNVSRSELLAGRSVWTLQAAEDAPLGRGQIAAVLMTSERLISATAAIEVVPPPPPPREKRRSREPETGPNLEWVTREGWPGLGWSERTVGGVYITSESTDILVNRDQRLLSRALSRNLSRTELEIRENRYLFAVACGLYRQEYQSRDLSELPDDDYVLAEQERLAEAVIIAIDEKLIDFDDD